MSFYFNSIEHEAIKQILADAERWEQRSEDQCGILGTILGELRSFRSGGHMTTDNHEDERRQHDDNHPRRCLHARDAEHVRQVSGQCARVCHECVSFGPAVRMRVPRDACVMLRARYAEVTEIPESTSTRVVEQPACRCRRGKAANERERRIRKKTRLPRRRRWSGLGRRDARARANRCLFFPLLISLSRAI